MSFSRLLTFSFLALAGCGSATMPSPDHVDVEISSDRSIVNEASPAEITVSIINRSTVAFPVHDSDCVPIFDVLDEHNNVIGPWSGGACHLVARAPRYVQPNETLQLHGTWDGSGSSAALEAGTFRVRARVVIAGAMRFSTPISIEVILE